MMNNILVKIGTTPRPIVIMSRNVMQNKAKLVCSLKVKVIVRDLIIKIYRRLSLSLSLCDSRSA